MTLANKMEDNWVTIDQEACTSCGICASRCACFTFKDKNVSVQADITNCNLCGHCVALCAVDAITHQKMDMDNFPLLDPEKTVDTESLIQLIRKRRSVRAFKKNEPSRADLEKLVDLCRYAPTGSNVQNLEMLMVTNKERIAELSSLAVDYFVDSVNKTKKGMDEAKANNDEAKYQLLNNTFQYQNRLVELRKTGYDSIFHRAPVVVIFHSIRDTSAPKDNAVIAAATMSLTAMTMGLESTYIGLFESAAKVWEPLQKSLDLPVDHQVFSVLIMGYPKIKFLRGVDRLPMRVKWEE